MNGFRLWSLAVLVLLAGCSPSPTTVVGSWRVEATDPTGKKATNTIVFNADGTMLQTMQYGEEKVEVRGRYTASEGRMTQKLESVTSNGKPIEGQDTSQTDLTYSLEGDRLILRRFDKTDVTLERVGD